ncbi:hypothetical protein TrispH2_006524 [Trichoplax sp. H2]|nr:hypothetical protein TrispH2_006524 [Trichoplax sp. H2]|eukprot:RDD42355.1 hypothetical protein TrispH2_006524 [Trichoplax sp. H2]
MNFIIKDFPAKNRNKQNLGMSILNNNQTYYFTQVPKGVNKRIELLIMLSDSLVP